MRKTDGTEPKTHMDDNATPIYFWEYLSVAW